MYSFVELEKIFLEELLKDSPKGQPAELYDPINYSLSIGGKRLRPILLLMACDLFEGKIQEAFKSAIGIEVFHNFTLIHDDIMDRSPLRRGEQTVYKKWDENIAILSGDTMFAHSMKYLASTDHPCIKEILMVFTQTAIHVCEGQQFDINFEEQPYVSISDYLEMIHLKTSVLLACSLKIGAIIADAPMEDQEKIYEYGLNLGLAFQLKDDFLDVFGDEKKFGKKTGGDILSNKKTFLLLKAFEKANTQQTKILESLMNDYKIDPDKKVQKVKDLYIQLKIKEETEKKITSYYQNALDVFSTINLPENRKEEIAGFANKLMKRVT